MNKTRIVLGLLLLIAVTLPAAAQRRSLTIDEAIRLGIESSKTLHTSASKAEAADARVSEAGAGRLPSLKFSGGYTRLSPVDPFTFTIPGFGTQTLSPVVLDNWNFGLTLTQPIFTGFRLSGNARVAERSADAAHLDYEKDRRDLVFNIRTAYWNVFKLSEITKVLDSTIAQVGAHLTDVKNMLAQGLATNNDVLKVQVQLSNVRLQQIDAVNGARLATMALNNLIGLPIDSEIDVTSTAATQSRTFGETRELVQKAISSRPDIKAMEQRVEASEAAVSIARGGWYPQVFLVGNYTYAKPNQRIVPTVDEFRGTWSAGISAAWDVWTWGTAGYQTTQAQAQLAQTQDALGLMKDGISLEVNQNAMQLAKAKERIAIADEGVKQAEENLRVTNDKYKMGLVVNSEVIDATVALQQARTNFTQAVVDFELAQAGLEKAIGQ